MKRRGEKNYAALLRSFLFSAAFLEKRKDKKNFFKIFSRHSIREKLVVSSKMGVLKNRHLQNVKSKFNFGSLTTIGGQEKWSYMKNFIGEKKRKKQQKLEKRRRGRTGAAWRLPHFILISKKFLKKFFLNFLFPKTHP